MLVWTCCKGNHGFENDVVSRMREWLLLAVIIGSHLVTMLTQRVSHVVVVVVTGQCMKRSGELTYQSPSPSSKLPSSSDDVVASIMWAGSVQIIWMYYRWRVAKMEKTNRQSGTARCASHAMWRSRSHGMRADPSVTTYMGHDVYIILYYIYVCVRVCA